MNKESQAGWWRVLVEASVQRTNGKFLRVVVHNR